MSEPQPPDMNVVDQQRRVITGTRQRVNTLLSQLGLLDDDLQAYFWLGLSEDSILLDESFQGTGTDRESYRAAITSIQALKDLLTQGHGTNLAKFAL